MIQFLFRKCTSNSSLKIQQSLIIESQHYIHPQHSQTNLPITKKVQNQITFPSEKTLIDQLEKNIQTQRFIKYIGNTEQIICEDQGQTAVSSHIYPQGNKAFLKFTQPKKNNFSKIKKIENLSGKNLSHILNKFN